jgi:hypothetical protein
VVGLLVVGLPEVGFAVVGLPVVGLPEEGFAVVGEAVPALLAVDPPVVAFLGSSVVELDSNECATHVSQNITKTIK